LFLPLAIANKQNKLAQIYPGSLQRDLCLAASGKYIPVVAGNGREPHFLNLSAELVQLPSALIHCWTEQCLVVQD